ncbi:hypothetical protein LTR08_005293 [Meristemomyces frigidus]|nr:hypothetical protein LTR08_005293 [Meristemomyces frigidus]
MSALTQDQRRFINVPAGCACVLDFSKVDIKAQNITAVGTSECYTCIGVYFAIDEHRCFIAHINPSTGRTSADNDKDLERLVSADEGKTLGDFVLSRIRSAIGADWQPDMRAQRSLVLVCFRPSEGVHGAWLRPYVGHYVVKAITDYFSVDEAAVFYEGKHGFIVDQYDGILQVLGFGEKEVMQAQDYGFQHVAVQLAAFDAWVPVLKEDGSWCMVLKN